MEHFDSPTSQNDLGRFDLGLPPVFRFLTKKILGLDRAEALYAGLRATPAQCSTPSEFCKGVLARLGVPFDLPLTELQTLRQLRGPVVFVANHPLGAIDALILMVLMGEVRRDFKFVGNAILQALPELGAALVPMQIMSGSAHPGANILQMRNLLRYLSGGGMLGIFPAGEVAAYDSWRSSEIVEREWSPHVARLVKLSRATVVPVYFEGRNSLWFQYLGLTLPSLRIALLARELLSYRKPVRFKVGVPVSFAEIEAHLDAETLSDVLRNRTLGLKHNL